MLADKPIRSSPLAGTQPLTIISWPEALNASGSWRSCRMAIRRNTRPLFVSLPRDRLAHNERCLGSGGLLEEAGHERLRA
jgi:hypothetical protein